MLSARASCGISRHAIKARLTRRLVERGICLAQDRRGEYDLWQRRFWEHLIRDEQDFARHVDYIHYNPVKVKHGWVARPLDWRWSSIHRYVRLVWGFSRRLGGRAGEEGRFGE